MSGLQTTGYTKDTPLNYWIDAGAIYTNLAYDTEKGEWTGELLGATSGGNQLLVEQEYRAIEVDGVFVPAKGQKALESSTAKLVVNLKEITAENLRLAINGTVRDAETDEAPEGYKVVEGKSELECEDYIENIGIVGTITGSTQPIIAILYNALCVSGMDPETQDNDEAVISMEFEAHADADQVANRKLPVKIFFPPIDKTMDCDNDVAVAGTRMTATPDTNSDIEETQEG